MFSSFSFVTPLYAQEQPPASVVITKVNSEKVSQTQSVIGIVYYDRISEVSTEVTGLVQTVLAQKGSHVRQGDALVRLDTEMLDNEIALKKTHIAQNDLLLKNTGKNFKRLETLYKESGVSEKDYDDALFTFQNARLEKQARQEELANLLIKRNVVLSVRHSTALFSQRTWTAGPGYNRASNWYPSVPAKTSLSVPPLENVYCPILKRDSRCRSPSMHLRNRYREWRRI